MVKARPRAPTGRAPTEKLEASTLTPTGGVTPRCQARKKTDGQQCQKPARAGYRTCSSHGAGTAVREAAGTRKPPGRPIVHGIYSKHAPQTLAELREYVAANDVDLDNSDEAVRTLKAVSALLFQRCNWVVQKSELFESAIEAIEAAYQAAPRVGLDKVPGENELTLPQARQMAADLAQAKRLLSEIDSFLRQLSDNEVRVITSLKLRAETRARKAESEALLVCAQLFQKQRNLLSEILTPELHDLYEYRLAREVGGPARITLPDDPTLPPEAVGKDALN